jgi:hypothetical protein
MPINSFLYPGAKFTPPYEVANSVRFNGADSPALKRDSMGTATNRKKWTLSMWVKRSTTDQRMLASFDGAASYFQFQSGGQLEVNDVPGSSFNYRLVTNAIYRDISAWYHIVVAFDSTQGTASNRIKLYVNGAQPTLGTATYPDQNFEPEVNSTGSHKYGSYDDSADYAFNGYFCEIVFIDGTQYAASDFGEYDSDSPRIWRPKDPSGLTFGTNGHYLDFEDSSNLGNDKNGGTDFNENNIAAADQATDTCTNNFCTLNSLMNYRAGSTFSEGNCYLTMNATNHGVNYGTFALTAGKWYFEGKLITNTTGNYAQIGITDHEQVDSTSELGEDVHGYGYTAEDGKIRIAATQTTYGNSYDDGDIIGVILNLDDNEIKFSKNGTVQNSGTAQAITAVASTANGFYLPAFGDWDDQAQGAVWAANFGGCPAFSLSSAVNDENGYGNFEYAPPSGFLAICSKNLGSDGG